MDLSQSYSQRKKRRQSTDDEILSNEQDEQVQLTMIKMKIHFSIHDEEDLKCTDLFYLCRLLYFDLVFYVLPDC